MYVYYYLGYYTEEIRIEVGGFGSLDGGLLPSTSRWMVPGTVSIDD